MSKQLVCVDNLDDFICKATGKVYADGTIILTPGAKDELARRGVGLVHGPAPKGAQSPSCGCASGCPECSGEVLSPDAERLLLGVAGILKTQYGITDPEQLRALSIQTIKTLKEHI